MVIRKDKGDIILYEDFAFIYDDLMADVDYEKWYFYILEMLNRFNREPKCVLEMACGTGNLSYYFAKDRFDLTCFDLSTDMLSVAYNKLSKFKNVTLLNQNMVDFRINKKFDLILAICDSINYILDESQLLETFRNVKKHLDKGGIFIFDINSYYKLKEIIGNNTFIEDTDDIFYIWQNYFDDEDNICQFYLTFFIKREKGNYRRFDEEHLEKAYKEEEICELLKNAGFSQVEAYHSFTFNKPSGESERIHFVCLP